MKLALLFSIFAASWTQGVADESGIRGTAVMTEVEGGVDVDPESQSHRELFSFSFTNLMYLIHHCKYPGEKKGCPPCRMNNEPRKVCKLFDCSYDDSSSSYICVPPPDINYCYGSSECKAAHNAYYGGSSSSSNNGGGGDNGDSGDGDYNYVYSEDGDAEAAGGDNGGGDGGRDEGYYQYDTTTNTGGSVRYDNHSASVRFNPILYIVGGVAVAGLIGAIVFKARTFKKSGDLKTGLIDGKEEPKVLGAVSKRLELAKASIAQQPQQDAAELANMSTEVSLSDYSRA